MNLDVLGMGMAGVWEAAALALLVGVLAQLLVHALLTRRMGWTHGHEIGWACLLALVVGCGADLWHLFYMFIVPMQSPVSIRRVLSGIHDPDFLSTRVFAEVTAAITGVLLGWWACAVRARRHGPDADQERE